MSHKVYSWGESQILEMLDRLEEKFDIFSDRLTALENVVLSELDLLNKEIKMTQAMFDAMTALAAEVAEVKTVEESAVALINKMAGDIALLAQDPAAILAYVDQMRASAANLAAAVQANTIPPVV